MTKKNEKKKGKKRGRKDKWTQLEMDTKLDLVRYWISSGYTEKSICESLGISVSLWEKWKVQKIQLKEAVKKGREETDALVYNSVLKRIQGYKVNEEEEEVFRDDLGNPISSRVKRKEKYVTPSDTLAIFWLKNRMNWKDKVENEHSGDFVFDVKIEDDEDE